MAQNYGPMVQSLRESFSSGKTLSLTYREKQLRSLMRMYKENGSKIVEALAIDLRKSKQETVTMEIGILVNDLRSMLGNLSQWAKCERPPKDIVTCIDGVYVYHEPFGVVLVFGAWNYPLQLTMAPVHGAIAAGNCVIIKPSEVSSATSKFFADTIPKYLDSSCYKVVTGGPVEATALLRERFDFICFTGSTTVGKIIHAAAAKHLTPTMLELGGKSPTYIDDSVDITLTARRLLWGKCVNAGQTCIAPDYVLCSRKVQEKLLGVVPKIIREFFGDNMQDSPDFPRIVNDRNFSRLVQMLDNGRVAYGGNYDAKDRYIELTVLTDLKETDLAMTEEIFGPILPIFNVESAYEAINFIKKREKPLSLYLFSNNKSDVKLFLTNTSSGGVCVNDTIMHFAVEALPFGGVGCSGMGKYHGEESYKAFTHRKSCLYKGFNPVIEKLAAARYPPYSESKIHLLSMLTKKRFFPSIPFGHIFMFIVGALVAWGGKSALKHVGWRLND